MAGCKTDLLCTLPCANVFCSYNFHEFQGSLGFAASQRGVEKREKRREVKLPPWKYCENEKQLLLSSGWPFWKSHNLDFQNDANVEQYHKIGRYKSRTGSTRAASPGRINSDRLGPTRIESKNKNKIKLDLDQLGAIKKIKLNQQNWKFSPFGR